MDASTTIPGALFTVVTPNEAPDNRVQVNFNEPHTAPNEDTFSSSTSGDSGATTAAAPGSGDSSFSPPVVTFTTVDSPFTDPVSTSQEDSNFSGDSSSPPQVWDGSIVGSPTDTNDVTFVPDDWPNEDEDSLPVDTSAPPVEQESAPYQPGELVLTTNIPGATFSEGDSGGQTAPSPDVTVGVDVPDDESLPADHFVIDGDDNSTTPVDELPPPSDVNIETSVQTNATMVDNSITNSTASAATEEESDEDETNQIDDMRGEDPQDMDDSGTPMRALSLLTTTVAITLALAYV